MSTSNKDYWWWADGLYMVMPVMTKLYEITGNELVLPVAQEAMYTKICFCSLDKRRMTKIFFGLI